MSRGNAVETLWLEGASSVCQTRQTCAQPAGRPRHTSLKVLRSALCSDPPAGAEVALTCNYDPKILAKQCGCSLRRLEQIFHEANCTLHAWLVEHRLLRDVTKLEQLDATGQLESIKRFALEAGYRYPRNFDRAFKRQFGVPPKVFLAKREEELKKFGIDLSRCRSGQQSYPIVELRLQDFVF